MFFWNSCFFHDPSDVGNLISGSSAFSKTSLNIREFMVHVLLKPGLENFEHHFPSMWDECNCAVVWAFFGIVFLWNLNENWLFQSCGHCWVFQICWHTECSTFTTSSFRIWNESVGPCPVLTLASWPAYRFLRRQIRWSGIPISFRIFQLIVIHTVKGFGIVNKAETDVFLELSCFFDDPVDVGNLIWFLCFF